MKPGRAAGGQIIGGGVAVGAYGGRAEIMEMIAPLGPVYQAGTLSGNPLAMAAGLAALKHLRSNPDIYERLERRTANLVNKVLEIAQNKGVPLSANRVRSMFTWFFHAEGILDWDSTAEMDNVALPKVH